MTTRLFLIRHGEVESRYHRVFGGSRIDMELSPDGHQQAERLANVERIAAAHAAYPQPLTTPGTNAPEGSVPAGASGQQA